MIDPIQFYKLVDTRMVSSQVCIVFFHVSSVSTEIH